MRWSGLGDRVLSRAGLLLKRRTDLRLEKCVLLLVRLTLALYFKKGLVPKTAARRKIPSGPGWGDGSWRPPSAGRQAAVRKIPASRRCSVNIECNARWRSGQDVCE